MNNIAKLSLALWGIALPAITQATEYALEFFDVPLYTSSGASAPNLTFSFGTFKQDFTPLASNVDEWAANWLTVGTPGVIEESGGFWSTPLVLANNSVVPAGAQLYAWAYDTLDIESATAEWLLITDSAWSVVTSAGDDPRVFDYYPSAQTEVIIGAFNYIGTAQLAAVSGSAVPEPSAFAALAGLGALGFGAFQRRRRSGC